MELIVRYDDYEEMRKFFRLMDEFGYENIHRMSREDISDNRTQCVCVDSHDKCYFPLNVTCAAGAASAGGRFYLVDELEMILMDNFKDRPRQVVFHVPHDGFEFPEDLMESVCIPQDKFMRLHEDMRDKDIGFAVPKAFNHRPNLLSFRTSRLLCDVERFTGEEGIMNQFGMGYCYEKAYNGMRIKNITPELLEATRRYYDRHHSELDRIARTFHKLLLIDLHSYRDAIVPETFRTDEPMPDVCIGTDDKFTDSRLTEAAVRVFTELGFSVEINYPYRGSMIPDCIMSGEVKSDFQTIMLEFNRRCYLRDGKMDNEANQTIQNAIKKIILASHEIDTQE